MTTTPTQTLAPEQLRAIDRCDSCGAPARVRATLASTSLSLMFCGHHANKAEAKLKPQTSEWLDEREFIPAGVWTRVSTAHPLGNRRQKERR